MNEIEKMYSNAGIKCLHPSGFCKHIGAICEMCKRHNCPPFNAEKQIELIKFLLKNYKGIDINKRINRFNFLVDNDTFIGCHHNDKSFEESLAGVINKLWIDMPEEEKQQIKEVLK